MQRDCQGALKRKRRASDEHTDIENVPTVEAKRLREEAKNSAEESLNDGRHPLTELPLSSNDHIEEAEGEDDMSSDTFSLADHSGIDFNTLDLSSSPQPTTSEGLNEELEIDDEKQLYKFNVQFLRDFFCRKDLTCEGSRKSNLFSFHAGLVPRMRTVLLEWLIEVADVYKLYRETYYLALDYLDRYLSLTCSISKHELQLIGVTCLLIAAKFEEIYPPKVAEFAYITDGACTEMDIIHMEMKIMRVLDWKCTVITCNSWISAYLQLLYHRAYENKINILWPQYSTEIYEKIAHLIDLCSLDEGFLRFDYRILAVSTIYTTCTKSLALDMSALEYTDIEECVCWMQPFWEVTREKFGHKSTDYDLDTLPPSPRKPYDFSHAQVKHSVTLELLEIAQSLQESTKIDLDSSQLLTPPSSSRKKKRYPYAKITEDDSCLLFSS